jgi:hypothetical protein
MIAEASLSGQVQYVTGHFSMLREQGECDAFDLIL